MAGEMDEIVTASMQIAIEKLHHYGLAILHVSCSCKC